MSISGHSILEVEASEGAAFQHFARAEALLCSLTQADCAFISCRSEWQKIYTVFRLFWLRLAIIDASNIGIWKIVCLGHVVTWGFAICI